MQILPEGVGSPKICAYSVNVQRTITEREGRWVPVKEPNHCLVVVSILPPVSHGSEGVDVPRAFSQDVSSRLQGVFVAVGTCGWLVWKEPCPVFTRRGVVREDMGDAAQVACIPFRHIVKEVAGVLCEGGLEDFLLSANWEPLGPPVRGILPALLPIVLGAARRASRTRSILDFWSFASSWGLKRAL